MLLSSTQDVVNVFYSSLAAGCLKRISDGETGERHYFVHFQRFAFERASLSHVLMNTLDPSGFRTDHSQEEIKTKMDRFLKLETGIDTAVVESYTILRQDKATGKIPVNVKFQVGIPTPASFVGPNIQPAFQAQVETHYEAALLKAIQNIQANIPHDDLAIQFDVAMEFGLVHGAWYEEWIGPIA